MTDSPDNPKLDICSCCEDELPKPILHNPPGQPALDYRVGTHSEFMQRLIARLPKWTIPDGDNQGQRPLASLTTRASEDPAIALLDTWAVVGDVLTFYQERIANEGFLRTATERRSVLELARAIGYELAPGVAGSTYLAFTVDESEGSPKQAPISAGTQVQSIPSGEGELPQTFETSEAFVAHARWNVLRPQLTESQSLGLNSEEVYLQGSSLNLSKGDLLLFVQRGAIQDAWPRRIKAVKPDFEAGRTQVRLEVPEIGEDGDQPTTSPGPSTGAVAATPLGIAPGVARLPLNEDNIKRLVFDRNLTESRLQAFLRTQEWNLSDYLTVANRLLGRVRKGPIEVFALREKVGFFGNTAPKWASLPASQRYKQFVKDNSQGGETPVDPAYPVNWDKSEESTKDEGPKHDPRLIWTDSQGNALDEKGVHVLLERSVSDLTAWTWAVFEQPKTDGGFDHEVYQLAEVSEVSQADYGISGKVAELMLVNVGGIPLPRLTDTDSKTPFLIRKTTAYLKSEKLTPAKRPIKEKALQKGDTIIPLEHEVTDLQKGQPVLISGDKLDAEGVQRTEVKILENVSHTGGRSTIELTEGLEYSYLRETVTLNANVVPATHGETVADEALGSGDASKPNQRFKLNESPLTYVSADTVSGRRSTLTVRVDGIEWEQKSSLFRLGPNSKSYTVRINNEAQASVIFGDGQSGARLPTGQENVIATYRSGIGTDGLVGARSLTLLKTRPFGIKSVTNPQTASGAEDPESLADARQNAPTTVLTLDRIVSLQDYQDFARTFAGIGKARAVALWIGQREIVHLTIAGVNGEKIDSNSKTYLDLADAIAKARDPLQEVRLESFQPRFFNLDARVLIDPAYQWKTVKASIKMALQKAFGFEQRTFGQPVSSAEVMTVIHRIDGVKAVDLDALYRVDESGQPVGRALSVVLPARNARPNKDGVADEPDILPAQLLMINESGIGLGEMKP